MREIPPQQHDFLHFLYKLYYCLDAKKILTTLIKNKDKFKEILQEQSNSMNNTNNQYGAYYEGECSTNFNAKQKLKYLFSRLKKARSNNFNSNLRIFFIQSQ